MKTLLKIFVGLIAVLAGLVVVLVVAVKVIDDEQKRKWLVSAVEKSTGRAFRVESLALDLGGTIRARLDGVSLANAEWGGDPEMLAARQVEASIHLASLLDGVADISASADGLRVRVETAEDGRSNWQFGASDPEKPAQDEETPVALKPLIRRILVTDTVIEVSRTGTEQVNTFGLDRLELSTPESDTLLSLDGRVDDWPLSLSGNLGPLVDVVDRISAPVSLTGRLAEISLDVGGQWGPLAPSPELALNARLAASSTAAVAAMAGVTIGEPGALDATLDLAADGGRFSLQNLALDVSGDLVTAKASGDIADLNNLQGMAVDVNVTTAALNDLLRLFGVTLPNPLPDGATLSGHVHGDQGRIGARDIQAELRDAAVSISASGRIDDVVSLAGLDAAIEGSAPSLAGLSRFAGVRLPDLGAVAISGNLGDGDSGPGLSGLDARLESEDLALRIGGAMADLTELAGIDAEVDLDIRRFTPALRAELEATLAQFDLAVPLDRLPDSLKAKGRVTGDLKTLAVSDLEAAASDSGLGVNLAGRISNVIALSGVEARIRAEGPTRDVLKRQVGFDLPELGNLTLSTLLRSTEQGFALSETDARLGGGIADVTLTGGVSDLVGMTGIDARATLQADGLSDGERDALARLLERFEVEAPLDRLPASLALETALVGGVGTLALRETRLTAADAGVSVSVSGGAEDVIGMTGIAADITLDADSVEALSRFAGTSLPALGALELAGRLESGDAGVWGVRDVTVRLAGDGVSANLNGSVADLVNLKGVSATLEASTSDLSLLGAAIGQDLPAGAPIRVNARLDEVSAGGTRVTASAKSGDASITVEGDLSALRAPERASVRVAVAAETLADFQPFTEAEIPDIGPLTLSGRFQANHGKASYQLRNFRLSLDNQSARGDLMLLLAGESQPRTSITGDLTVPFLDLTPLVIPAELRQLDAVNGGGSPEPAGAAPEAEAASAGQGADVASTPAPETAAESASESGAQNAGSGTAGKRIFPDDPLILEQMRLVDADVEVTAERLLIGKTTIRNLNTRLALDEGLLRLAPLSGVADEGSIEGSLTLDGRQPATDLSVDLVVNKVPMPVTGGHLDLKVDLEGRGATPAAIMASLNGDLLLQIRGGRIPQSFATRLGKGLFSFSRDRDYTDLECGILRVDVSDGVANFDERLAVQLTEVNWTGGGEIDFNTEEMAVAVAPKPRKGIGITVGELASLVYVGGTLAAPSVRLNPKDVAIKYGKYLAYVSTGGLSLVAEALFNRAVAGRDLCTAIAEGTVFSETGDRESGGSDNAGSAGTRDTPDRTTRGRGTEEEKGQ